MDKKKQEKLEKAGWKTGNSQDFLGLSDDELQLIEIKHKLGKMLKTHRTKTGLSQEDIAKKTGTTQPRIAMMENCHHSITVDALISTLIALKVDRNQIGDAIKDDNNLQPA